MTHAKLETQSERLAEIRGIVDSADEAVANHRIYDARLVARLARLIEAEMVAKYYSGPVQ